MRVTPAEEAETDEGRNKGRNENGSILNSNSLVSPVQSRGRLGKEGKGRGKCLGCDYYRGAKCRGRKLTNRESIIRDIERPEQIQVSLTKKRRGGGFCLFLVSCIMLSDEVCCTSVSTGLSV